MNDGSKNGTSARTSLEGSHNVHPARTLASDVQIRILTSIQALLSSLLFFDIFISSFSYIFLIHRPSQLLPRPPSSKS